MADSAPTSSRYIIASELATGGMATVYLGRMRGAVGFARTVAIKKLHPQYAKDPEFVGMFVDEARLAARIQHPNVVQTVDVVVAEGEVLLVMEYVAGETLSRIARSVGQLGQKIPLRIGCTIIASTLHGLHAAHEASDESGDNLSIVHRDVSPQNIIVGADGVARVLDFGVAKAVSRMQTTGEGQVKGKLSYMAPEQLLSLPISRAADIFSIGVVLWEVLTGLRLLKAQNEGELLKRLLDADFKAPSVAAPSAGLPQALDAIVLKALHRDPEKRYPTARAMALDVERVAGTASLTEIADWLKGVAGPALDERAAAVRALEKKTALLDNTKKLTVGDVLGTIRESTSTNMRAISSIPTLGEEIATTALASPSTKTPREPQEGDSLTGKPVTSPSIPRAELDLFTQASGRRRWLAFALVPIVLGLLGLAGWSYVTRTQQQQPSAGGTVAAATGEPPATPLGTSEAVVDPAVAAGASVGVVQRATSSPSSSSSSSSSSSPPPPTSAATPTQVARGGAAVPPPAPQQQTRAGAPRPATPVTRTKPAANGDPYESLGGRR